jgi:E3 ubiquitin-protein ligase makorin
VTSKKKNEEVYSLPKIPGPVSLAAAAGLEINTGMVKLIGDPSKNPSKWVNAPEFIPGSMFHGDKSPSTVNNYNDDIEEEEEEYFFSYSAVAMTGLNVLDNMTSDEASNLLCPFYEMTGACPWNDKCEYLHGLECEMCFKHCLHPHDMNQQKEHRRQCISNHENEMEKAFAVQRLTYGYVELLF